MKRLPIGNDHSIRFILLTLIATVGFGFVLVLGITQALTAENQPDAESLSRQTAYRVNNNLDPSYCSAEPCPLPPLVYKNTSARGVQHKPTLYVIFWGSNWNTKGSVLSRQIIKMYKNFSGSAYQGILTQYFDGTGRVEKEMTVALPYTDTRVAAPSNVDGKKLEVEAEEAVVANGWPKEFKNQYIVIPAPGTIYAASVKVEAYGCGYHEQTAIEKLNFSFVAYANDAPFTVCIENKDINGTTSATASHEYFESATDPFTEQKEASWTTPNGKSEITDICSGIYELPDGSWVQTQWDNYKNECALSDAEPAYVYTITEQATGVTTTTATLNGVVNPEGMETKYHFEYGSSPALGTSTAEGTATTNSSNQSVNSAISGLTTGTNYYYVLVAKNTKGTVKGRQQKFKTP